jgi:Ca2+-binding RTX toxin-like protein
MEQEQPYLDFRDILIMQDASLADLIDNANGVNVFVGTDADDARYLSNGINVTDWECYMMGYGQFSSNVLREVVSIGGAGNDTLYGKQRNDILRGGDGNDTIRGDSGDDTIEGGTGNDEIYGGYGDDTYEFFANFGHDIVYETPNDVIENDTFRFLGGIDTMQVELGRSQSDLFVQTLDGLNRATVGGWYQDSGNQVERFEFQDGTVWTSSQINSWLVPFIGTDDHDYLAGGQGSEVFQGRGGNDSITAGEGDDFLYGGAGADYLIAGAGNDLLDGGTGNDNLYGANNADTYIFSNGFGQDTIYESDDGSGASDIIRFAEGILPTEVELSRNGWDLFLKISGSDDMITVSSFFSDSSYRVERVEFTDGTVWDNAVLASAQYLGTDEADTIIGTDAAERFVAGGGDDYIRTLSGDDVVFGGIGSDNIIGDAGDDTLHGGGGSDALTGGEGADILDGGADIDYLSGNDGADIYMFARGSDQDAIYEYDQGSGGNDIVRFDTGIAVDQLWFSQVGNNLEVSIIGTSDNISIQNWYSDSAYRIEQFRTADSRLLLDSQVENLVQAMAAFSPPSAGQTTLPQNYQDALSPVIAANWQ